MSFRDSSILSCNLWSIVLTVTSCICVSPKSEHLVRPTSWPSASGLIIQPQSGMPRSRDTSHSRMVQPIKPPLYTYSMVRPLDICTAKHPRTGFTTRDTLLTSELSACMVLADPQNKTDAHSCMTDSCAGLGRLVQQHDAVLLEAWLLCYLSELF